MKEDNRSASGKGVVGLIIFLAGFIAALGFGWVVFPSLLFSQKVQPINFSHSAHKDSTCEDCHFFRDDGTFSGIPKIDKCKECHESQMGESESERVLVEEYIQNNREVQWLVYSWQPDNVFFDHAPHKVKGVECAQCHADVSKEGKLPAFRENRLTGYSMSTMGMVTCEKCHAERGATNACQMCHK